MATKATLRPRDVRLFGASAAPEATFDAAVDGWDEQLCCQTRTTRRPCRNAVRWRVVEHHQCSERHGDGLLLCTLHKNRWVHAAWMKILDNGWIQCCRVRFTRPEQCATFRPV